MLGYKYIGQKNWDAAINVFQFNVEAFPKSFNVYDSLGEAYMLSGQKDLAIKNYEKSLELNPKNENGLAMLKQLKEAPLVEKKSK